MILTCPQCGTRYQTDATLFASEGRKVRCAKCGHNWHQSPEALEPQADGEAEPPMSETLATGAPFRAGIYQPAAGTKGHAPPRRVEKWAVMAGWTALVVILVLMGWTALRFRQEIAAQWPQSASLFSALGFDVSPRGIKFEQVKYSQASEDGRPVLAVTGELVNTSPRELSIPPILVTITDQNRQELYRWTYAPGAATLLPGQALNFLTRLPNPPDGARHIEVRFAPGGK